MLQNTEKMEYESGNMQTLEGGLWCMEDNIVVNSIISEWAHLQSWEPRKQAMNIFGGSSQTAVGPIITSSSMLVPLAMAFHFLCYLSTKM